MTRPAYNPPVLKNNVKTQLLGAISAAATSLTLKSGEGSELETLLRGTASSTGSNILLNDTGDLGSLAVGDIIENLTDGSVAVVTDISGAPNSVATTPLEGGTDNTWTSGDVWVKNAQVATLTQFDSNGDIAKQERIKITDISSDTLTIERGYDGDTAQAFNADDYLYVMADESAVNEIRKFMANALMRFYEIEQGDFWHTTAAGSSNAYTATIPVTISAVGDVQGATITLIPDDTNTGAATLNLNSTSAIAIKKGDGSGNLTDVEANDIVNGQPMQVSYNGTFWVMVSPYIQSAAVTARTVEAKTSNYTISASNDIEKIFTNEGASSDVVFTLPTAAAGLNFDIVLAEDQNVVILPSSGDIIQVNTSAYSEGIYAAAQHTAIRLVAINATDWVAYPVEGTWSQVIDALYICGENGGSTVNRMPFSTETPAASSENLTQNMYNAAGTGDNTNAYLLGGLTNKVEKLNMYTEVTSNAANNLTESISQCQSGCTDGTNGYAVGYDNGAGNAQDDVQKLVYSSEATSKLTAVLSANMAHGSGAWDDTDGYKMGGEKPDSTASSSVEKFTYSSETGANHSDTLSGNIQYSGGCNDGNTKAYRLGGIISSTKQSSIEKLVFSTGTISSLAATLDTARAYLGAGHDVAGATGYACGGEDSGSAEEDTIEDIDFTAETSAQLGSTLTTPLLGPCCVSAYMAQ